MTEQEYLEMLENLRVLIKSGKAEEALPFLDELFELKPVRLKWSLVKAEALAALGRWDEGAGELFDLCWFHYTDDETHAYIQWYRDWREQLGDSLGEASCRYIQAVVDARLEANPDPFIARTNENVSECEQRFLSSPDDAQASLALANAYYIANRHIGWLVLRELLLKLHPAEAKGCPDDTVFPQTSINRDYIIERLAVQGGTFSVCARDDSELQTATVLAVAIKQLGHRAILLTPPLEYETDRGVKVADTVQISTDNLEERDGVIYCHPIRMLGKDGEAADNHAPLLAELSKLTEDGLIFLLSTSDAMDTFFMQPELQKLAERLSVLEMDEFSSHFNFGYVGQYTTYISQIYGFDAAAELEKTSTCAISIIVPARNSAETLRHTLQTCLEQTFDDYEIVVSDNSTDGNTAVRDLVRELDSPKIKYYKTPRNLGLTKSFEFAFLKANGEFLFSIGADDAVLPWGLETISEVLRGNPSDDLLQWDRGFYIWPSFVTKPQLGQFSIPRNYRKGEYNMQRYKGLEMVMGVMKNPEMMYILPMLYINSGCRRRYLKKLLEKSGRLWAGRSQDIYMGVINCVINREVLCISYPITLAGMAGASIGGNNLTGIRNVTQPAYSKDMRYGDPLAAVVERSLTAGGGIPGDRQLVYNCILRAVSFGMLPDTIIAQFDWDNIYSESFSQLLKMHPAYDRITTASAKYPYTIKEFGKHFGEEFLREMMIPALVVDHPDDYRCYNVGFGGEGLTLDSRKFGVTNIHEAVELFKNITNL